MQNITMDHHEIKKWSEKYEAQPALIDHTEAGNDQVGIRLNFPTSTDEALLSTKVNGHSISWEEFFQIFDEQQLMFVYEDNPEGNDPTLWYRFEKRPLT